MINATARDPHRTERPNVQTAVLYARVSSKEQERGGFSIPAQRKLLRAYAREHSLTPAAEFVDVETAGRVGRDGFEAMIRLVAGDRACRRILVEKTDRLYRNLRDWVTLDELGVEVHLVKEGVVLSDESVSSEKFVHGIKVLVAKNFLDNLSEETSKGMLEKARQGLWPSCAPLGYRNVDGPLGKRIIEPDPDTGPRVATLFEWYATGEHPLTSLAKKVADGGLLTRRSGRPLQRSQIHAMLRNPIYMGEFDWKGTRYHGLHAPLVSRDIWDRVQAILTGRAPQRRPGRQRHHFAFSGLLRCGECADDGLSFLLVGERHKGRYVYYRCEECKRRHRAAYVREEAIVDAYASTWQSASPPPALVAAMARAGVGQGPDDNDDTIDHVARLRRELNELRARVDTAYDDRLAGRIDADYFADRSQQWLSQIRILAEELTQAEAKVAHNRTDNAAPLELSEVAELFRDSANLALRRRLVQTAHSNSIWKAGKLLVEWREPAEMTRDFVLA